MSRMRSNFAANTISAAATAAIALLLIPVYIRIVGVEAYGLIALYLALRGFLQLLDLGAGPVVNREVARLAADPQSNPQGPHTLHTFQTLYWVVGILIGLVLVVAAEPVSERWVRAAGLSPSYVASILRLMGVLIALQWPAGFYQNALLGLERQVALSAIVTTSSIATHGLALAAMVTVARGVEMFFLAANVVAAVQLVALAIVYRRSLLDAAVGSFRLRALRHLVHFAAGAGAISLTGSILTHADKVLLSSILPLERFAQYSLAATVAGALLLLVTPVFNTFYPRYSSLLASRREAELLELHHFGAQVTTVVVVPAAALIFFFGRTLIELWTGDRAMAEAVAPLSTVLVVGTAINGCMTLPYALQLAHGWIRAATLFGIAAVLAYIPLILLLAASLGALGGGVAWLSFNVVYFVALAPMTHHRLLPGSFRSWLGRDIAIPAAVAIGITAAGSVATLAQASIETRAIAAVSTFVIAFGGAALSAGRVRQWMLESLRRRWA